MTVAPDQCGRAPGGKPFRIRSQPTAATIDVVPECEKKCLRSSQVPGVLVDSIPYGANCPSFVLTRWLCAAASRPLLEPR